MHEYIEREAAIKTVCNCSAHTCTIETCFRGCAEVQALSALPAAGVVEVVRCKDCRYWGGKYADDEYSLIGDQKCVKDAEWDEETACYYGFIAYHGPEFFCADGERKDGGQDGV